MSFESASTAKQPHNPPVRRPVMTLKSLMRLLLGALLGATVGYGFVAAAEHLGVSPKALTWSDGLAIWMGIVFVAFGIVMAWLSINRRQLAQSLEGASLQDAEEATVLPATNAEVRSALLQAAVLALAGILLLTPILAVGPLRAHPGMAIFIYVGIVTLFLIQTALNIELWRSSDEFLRQTLLVVSAVTFAVGQGLLFLYAAAERLHLVRPISSWEVVTPLLTLYLVVSFGIGIKQRR